MIRKTLQAYYTTFLILTLAMFLAACDTQEPVRIRVTPTPVSETVVAEVQVTDTSVIAPTDTIVPSETTIPPTRTPIQTDGSFGPIIMPGHTPPPTSTPRPTEAATELPTFTPIPQTPVATTISNLPFLDSSQMGIQLYYNVTIDEWWQWLRRTDPLHVSWIKVQANWKFLQPDNRDEFDTTAFSIFESHVQRAHNDGWHVLVSIAKAPNWARGGATDQDGPPANPDDLDYFINALLDRMGQQISAIEIWNEPNLSREWTGGLQWNGAGYMQLFRPAYDTIRAYSPDIAVVTAGLAPTRAEGTIDDRLFLQQMYQAGLGDPYYQNIAVGVHPYGWGNPPDARCCDNIPNRGWDDDPRFFFLNTLEDYRNIMLQYGHQNVQLWATEFGWATWEGFPNQAPEEWMNYNTAALQAQYTIRAFQIGQSLDYVGPMFLWNMNFANNTLVEQRNEMAAYSLFIPNLPIRPLYDALANRPQ